jgi:hypothetical protein
MQVTPGNFSTEQELYAAKLAEVRRIIACDIPRQRTEDEFIGEFNS